MRYRVVMSLNESNHRSQLGTTGITVPPIIFGTSALGNLYQVMATEERLELAREWFAHVDPPVVLDTAGKYGAGLALERLGKLLKGLGIAPDNVILSNKVGWYRVELSSPEPTFEPGVWRELEHDAEQRISYRGILDCWEQGCELLGEHYVPSFVSVHDPDEYLDAAESEKSREERFEHLLEAYRALTELKNAGNVSAVGVGAKEWQVIRRIAEHVELDWVMFACSITVYTHPREVLSFVEQLADQRIGIINSAVFNSGFLVGGAYFDYRQVDRDDNPQLFEWRERFLDVCARHEVFPGDACIEFGLSVPGVSAVALNTSNPKRVRENVRASGRHAPDEFWSEMKERKLIDSGLTFL